MSSHTLGWRAEIRDTAGRLLGSAVHCAGETTQLWEVETVDGRRTTVGTRIQALTALASMCDTVDLPEDGEPDDTP